MKSEVTRSSSRRHLSSAVLLFVFLFTGILAANAQQSDPGLGAISAQNAANRNTAAAMLALLLTTAHVMAIGCSSAAKTDPGTAKGIYTVVVTGIAGSGSSQYQTSVNVPVTMQ